MSSYELYQQLDKWYRWQAIKTFPTYIIERLKMKFSR